MSRLAFLVAAFAALTVAAVPQSGSAQQSPKGRVEPKMKVPRNMKVCRYTFPDGERRTWLCRKEEPCCAWDAIKYVKCGSTITRCL